MAPKHGLANFKAEEEQAAKRAKGSATPASRSATPSVIDTSTKVPFKLKYPGSEEGKKKKNMSAAEIEELKQIEEHKEWQVSPFEAKGALREGELDQFYTVTPITEWASMKKYNNFISKLLSLQRWGSANERQFKERFIRTTNLCLCGVRIRQRTRILRDSQRTSGLRAYCKYGRGMRSMYMHW